MTSVPRQTLRAHRLRIRWDEAVNTEHSSQSKFSSPWRGALKPTQPEELTDNPVEKIRWVVSNYLIPAIFEGLSFKACDELNCADVREKGGVVTEGDVVFFDPDYVLTANDRVLAFVLAHEHGHWKQDIDDDAEADNDADEHALMLLLKSGWDLGVTEACLAACKSHFEWYHELAKGTKLDSSEEPVPFRIGSNLVKLGLWESWVTLTTLNCAIIWKEQSGASLALGSGSG